METNPQADISIQRTILIVDDEAINLRFLEIMLSQAGYNLLKGINGEEAIQMAKEHKPDLIIMDINMPGIDGIEACKILKSDPDLSFTPIILVTSHQETEFEVLGLDSGADEYIIKPPKRPELLARVRAQLRTRDLQHALLQAKKIIQDDLDQVGKIQQSFLPSKFPYHPNIDFGQYYGPCHSAGGDYFDLIEISNSQWGLLIADVTGHGAPAAVVMAITHTLMHSFMSTFQYPSTVLKVANEKLNAHLAPTFYVTMFYSVLNLQTMTLRFASAGHEPMMLYRSKSKTVEWLKTEKGFPLKLMASDDFDEKEVNIEAGDKLILYTDGMIERRNEQRIFLSNEQIEQWVVHLGHLPAQKFVDAMIDKVKAFNPSKPFEDDVTMFVIHRTA
jgi:serine phosphatase RsbU (regulator of sigma subunit)